MLTRRAEHARALNDEGLRVSGRAELTARVSATDRPGAAARAGPRARLLQGHRPRGGRAAPSPGTSPGGDGDDVQNGLGAEEIVGRHGDWPLLSSVTFMSGTRHSDAHVEYVLDTATWIGPSRATDAARSARRSPALIRSAGLQAEAIRRPAARRSGRS